MRKNISVVACISLFLVLLAIGYVVCMTIKGYKFDISSKAYVNANIPAIISSWSEAEVLRRASKELKEDLAGQQWDRFYSKVSQLGKYQNYEGCDGKSNISFSLRYGEVITAVYTAYADYQNGRATIKMELVRRNNDWQIAMLTIDSPLFSK